MGGRGGWRMRGGWGVEGRQRGLGSLAELPFAVESRTALEGSRSPPALRAAAEGRPDFPGKALCLPQELFSPCSPGALFSKPQ